MFTQQEFDALPSVAGRKQCPAGDYSAIKEFPARCDFGTDCTFATDCYFGAGCRFGAYCCFGAGCCFGSDCTFGAYCRFGAGCTFAQGCIFATGCNFGASCRFGSDCDFAPKCKVEGKYTLKSLFQLSYAGSANRQTTAFNTEEGIFIRCGCFFGTLTEFKAQVREAYPTEKHGKVYAAWAGLVELQFSEGA